MMDEEWRDIKGWEGIYQVSSKGRVKSFLRKTVKILVLHSDGHGYPIVTLSYKGRKKKAKVHRLVAEAFIPNPEKKPQVDHINTNRWDSRVENLRWVTRKENEANPITYSKRKQDVYGGEYAFQVAERNGICHSTYITRRSRGWSIEDACTIPIKKGHWSYAILRRK